MPPEKPPVEKLTSTEEAKEKRRYPRFLCNFTMEVKGLGDVTGTVVDMSLTGCRVKIIGEDLPITELESQIGNELKLSFIHENKVVDVCPALFRRIISEGESEIGLAFEFNEMPQQLLGKIFCIVFNHYQ